MNTLQRILIIALVAQLALVAFVFWPRPAASSGGEPLLGALASGEITGISITDDKGVSTTLMKQGESWVVPDVADYPADASKITAVLDKLVAMRTGRTIATSPASHAQLQVADAQFLRKIDLTRADGSSQTIYLGSTAGGQAVHARLGGTNEVYLANGPATWEATADLLSWINPVYLTLNANDVTALSLRNRNGEFSLTRDEQGQWQLAGLESGETLDANKATNLVASATSIRMTTPLGKSEDPTWGLQQPAAVVTMQVTSGDQSETITLSIGSQDAASNSYVVKSSESEYYARVAEFSVQELVERDRAGFLTVTATPAP